MPLFYNRVQRVNPRDPKDARKWYPILKSVGQVDEHEVAKLVADETTLTPRRRVCERKRANPSLRDCNLSA